MHYYKIVFRFCGSHETDYWTSYSVHFFNSNSYIYSHWSLGDMAEFLPLCIAEECLRNIIRVCSECVVCVGGVAGGRGLHEVQGKAQSLQYHQQQVELFSISSMLTYFRWLNSFKKNSSEDLIRQTTVLKIESYLIFKVIYHAVDCILQHNDQNVVEIGRSLNMRNSHHCNKCRLSIEAFKTILSIQYKYAKLKTNPSKTFLFTL